MTVESFEYPLGSSSLTEPEGPSTTGFTRLWIVDSVENSSGTGAPGNQIAVDIPDGYGVGVAGRNEYPYSLSVMNTRQFIPPNESVGKYLILSVASASSEFEPHVVGEKEVLFDIVRLELRKILSFETITVEQAMMSGIGESTEILEDQGLCTCVLLKAKVEDGYRLAYMKLNNTEGEI